MAKDFWDNRKGQTIHKPYCRARGLPAMKREGGGMAHDQYHCKCHRVDPCRISQFEEMLDGLGFERQVIEDDHGQTFGRRRRLSEHEQLHIKVMPDGWIEAEIEPPPEYPFAHLNQVHSHSAHGEVLGVLRECRIRFWTVRNVPATCLDPVVVKPVKPTSLKALAAAAGVGIAGFFTVLLVNKLRS